MRRGGGRDEAPDKVMGPLFPRLHVNDTVKGGPRAPPRNKMALYEQFSVPSHRFTANAPAPTPPWQPHQPAGGATSAVPSTSASQVGGNGRPLFPSFCVPSTEPARSADHKSTNSNGRTGNAARAESGRKSTQLKSKGTYAAGPTAGCSSQHRENNIQNPSGKKLTNDDDFTVPSVLYSGMTPHSTQEKVSIQEKFTPCPTTSPYKSVSAMSKSSSKCSNADRRHREGMVVSDAKSRDSPSIKEREPAKMMRDLETEERTSQFQTSKENLGRPDTDASLYKDRLNNFNYADKQHSGIEGYPAKSRKDNAMETQKNPPRNGSLPSSKPCSDMEHNGGSNILERVLREGGEKRKRSHQDVERKGDLSDSSVESLPELEISPDDVVSAIGPKHFWKARRAIVNQQRVFAVQVFELHRLIKVQKLIAASPHLLIEGDPCLGKALVASKKLAGGNMEKQPPSSKNKDDMQPTLQQPEYSKDNTGGNQPSPSQDNVAGVELQHDGQGTTNGAVCSNPPAMPTASENKQNSWCIPPPPNQWLVPVMSPSEGLIYKPYTGPCPPAGSFLAPFYAGCTPVSLPSTAGDFMNSAYGIPMPHQPQHMGVPGPPPMPPMYFPPFSMPVMNPAASASAVEQVSHVAAWPDGHREQHSRSSCNMSHLRSEALSAGIWRIHASRDSELQGSSASSPFNRQQGEGRGPEPLLAEPSGGNGQPQPLSGSKDNTGRVIRVVPHTARTASESAARIFQSIQIERQQSDL